MQELADAIGYSVGMISDLENHGKGSPRLKKAVREWFARRHFSQIENRDAGMYGLRETGKSGSVDLPSKEACLEYLRKFLDTCDTPDKIGWTKIELMESFPLSKWQKGKT